MEKLEEKKKKSFLKSKAFLFTVMSVLVLGLASALIVNYLSNTASVEVKVDSPFTSGFWNGVEVVNDLVLPDMYALETFSMENRIKNLGSVDTNVSIEYKISNDMKDVAVQDFSYVNIDVRSDGMKGQTQYGANESGNYHFFNGTMEQLCVFSSPHGVTNCSIDNGILTIKIPNFFWHNESAEVFTNLTFGPVAPANYTIQSTILVR
jgi:hypothetical protein